MRESQVRFIRQLGYPDENLTTGFYQAAMFQPRAVGVVLLLAVLTQSASVFLALAVALWWSALVPTHNPFTAVYDRVVAPRRPDAPLLGVTPESRRFAEGMAGTFVLAIATALVIDAGYVAWALEAMISMASAAAVFRDVCAGANLYHLLHAPAAGGRVKS